jgi:hypothetical protein
MGTPSHVKLTCFARWTRVESPANSEVRVSKLLQIQVRCPYGNERRSDIQRLNFDHIHVSHGFLLQKLQRMVIFSRDSKNKNKTQSKPTRDVILQFEVTSLFGNNFILEGASSIYYKLFRRTASFKTLGWPLTDLHIHPTICNIFPTTIGGDVSALSIWINVSKISVVNDENGAYRTTGPSHLYSSSLLHGSRQSIARFRNILNESFRSTHSQ